MSFNHTLILSGRVSSAIGPPLMATIAAQLSEKHSDNMEILFSEFKTSSEEQEKLRSCRPETKVLEVMMEFFSRSTNKEFKDALLQLGITERKLD